MVRLEQIIYIKIMGLFSKKDKYDGGKKLLERVNSTHVLYAARRNSDGSEIILGKSGFVSYNGEDISVICQGKKVFCCKGRVVKSALLQSGDGVVLSGMNSVNGKDETVTAYFTSPIKYNR